MTGNELLHCMPMHHPNPDSFTFHLHIKKKLFTAKIVNVSSDVGIFCRIIHVLHIIQNVGYPFIPHSWFFTCYTWTLNLFFFPSFYITMCHISTRLVLVLGSLQGSQVDQYNVDVFLPYSWIMDAFRWAAPLAHWSLQSDSLSHLSPTSSPISSLPPPPSLSYILPNPSKLACSQPPPKNIISQQA